MMFTTFQELKDHLTTLMETEGDGFYNETTSAFRRCKTPEELAEEIHKHVQTEGSDPTAWLIEAITEEFYFQWGRPPF